MLQRSEKVQREVQHQEPQFYQFIQASPVKLPASRTYISAADHTGTGAIIPQGYGWFIPSKPHFFFGIKLKRYHGFEEKDL